MFVTSSGPGMRARPMHALSDQGAGCFWFITDLRGAKDEEIKTGPDVCLAFADTDSNRYLSAEVLHDVAKATALWSNEAQAWWPKGPNDPEVRVLRVIPDNAEFWDTRGNSITVTLKLAAARLSGHPPDLGENKKVQLAEQPQKEAHRRKDRASRRPPMRVRMERFTSRPGWMRPARSMPQKMRTLHAPRDCVKDSCFNGFCRLGLAVRGDGPSGEMEAC
jgi:general stress protein 26